MKYVIWTNIIFGMSFTKVQKLILKCAKYTIVLKINFFLFFYETLDPTNVFYPLKKNHHFRAF